MQDMVTCLTFIVSHQSYVLQDLVPIYSCYCRGGLYLVRAVIQQLLHLISHLYLFCRDVIPFGRRIQTEDPDLNT